MNTGSEVRGILMNELGLTREYVRGLVDDIVRAEVAKRLDSVNIQQYLDRIIVQEIDRLSRGSNRLTGTDIREYVQRAAQEKMKEFITSRVQILTKEI